MAVATYLNLDARVILLFAPSKFQLLASVVCLYSLFSSHIIYSLLPLPSEHPTSVDFTAILLSLCYLNFLSIGIKRAVEV